MICWGVSDKDILFRHSVFPQSFKGKKPRFDFGKLWNLYDNPDGTIEGSLAWDFFVPTSRQVHSYGNRLADGRNERARASGKFAEDKKAIYLGAYAIEARSIRSLPTTENLEEVVSADVIHKIEQGEIAHAALLICIKPDVDDIEGTKTAIIDRLWNACAGPLNRGGANESVQENMRLPSAPLGSFTDGRPFYQLVWCYMRYRFTVFLWPLLRMVCQKFRTGDRQRRM